MARPQAFQGTLVSVGSSFIFGTVYYYATVLKPLNGVEIYAWRTLLTLPFLTLFMLRAGYWPLVTELAGRLRRNKLLLLPLIVSSLMLTVQFWIFTWAPVNGKALEVSLGYLLMPLAMVLCGRLAYGERLQPLQKAAVVCAVLGVTNQLWQLGKVSIEVMVVACGFPMYFLLRRRLRTDNLGGLWFDFLLMLPTVLWIVASMPDPVGLLLDHSYLFYRIPVLGLLSATGIAGFIIASRLLPLSLFGLLGYVEPVLLVLVSILLGERIRAGEEFTYLGVGLAVGLLALSGLFAVLRARR